MIWEYANEIWNVNIYLLLSSIQKQTINNQQPLDMNVHSVYWFSFEVGQRGDPASASVITNLTPVFIYFSFCFPSSFMYLSED